MHTEKKTHLEDIERDARLRADTVLVAPAAREAWLVERALVHVGQACYASNVVLHQWCKAGTLHGSIDQSTLKLVVEVDGIILLLDTSCKEPKKLTGCLESCTPLADGNPISGIPGKLLQSADQTLVRSLRAILGEWRLPPWVNLTSEE